MAESLKQQEPLEKHHWHIAPSVRAFSEDSPKQLWLYATVIHPASQIACALINLVACMKRLRAGAPVSDARLPQCQLDFLQACQNFSIQQNGVDKDVECTR